MDHKYDRPIRSTLWCSFGIGSKALEMPYGKERFVDRLGILRSPGRTLSFPVRT
jgi:hypothetical protein